jgi:hypothetical protein
VKTPTIHRNGSAREVLIEQYMAAAGAVATAIEVVRAAAPNGRDYQPQGDDAALQARREHEARLTRLGEVLDELQIIARHVRRAA